MFPAKHNFLVHHVTTNSSVFKRFWIICIGVRALCLKIEPSLIQFSQEAKKYEYKEFIERVKNSVLILF